jgi:hypothetical protein
VLRAFPGSSESGGVDAGSLRSHCALLEACLDRRLFEPSDERTIVEYLAFLCDVIAAGAWTAVELSVDRSRLVAALQSVFVFRRVTDYHIDVFANLGDDTTWSQLENLTRFLAHDTSHPAVFRVSWGY